MKNILNETPSGELDGRLKFSTKYVATNDIRNKEILNIGCGFGWFELFALNNGAKKIAAIEITEADLKTARGSINDTRAEFKTGSAIDIPYPDNSFNTIVSWEVIEHIPTNTEDIMFKEVCRVLQPNGTFYLSTPFRHPISNALDPAWWLIDHRHYSLEKLTSFGQNHNLELVDYQVRGRLWSLLALLNMYIAKWIFRRKPFLDKFFKLKNDAEYESSEKGYFNIFVKYKKV